MTQASKTHRQLARIHKRDESASRRLRHHRFLHQGSRKGEEEQYHRSNPPIRHRNHVHPCVADGSHVPDRRMARSPLHYRFRRGVGGKQYMDKGEPQDQLEAQNAQLPERSRDSIRSRLIYNSGSFRIRTPSGRRLCSDGSSRTARTPPRVLRREPPRTSIPECIRGTQASSVW